MKEEIIKEVIELTDERDRIVSEFRTYFRVNLNYCSISEVKKSNNPNEVVIITNDPLNPNKEHIFSINEQIIIRETGKTIYIDGSLVIINWIKERIKKLESINKKLEEL